MSDSTDNIEQLLYWLRIYLCSQDDKYVGCQCMVHLRGRIDKYLKAIDNRPRYPCNKWTGPKPKGYNDETW